MWSIKTGKTSRIASLYLCEIKFSKDPIGIEVIDEIKKKINALIIPKHHSIRPVLIHVNGVKDSLLEEGFFAHLIDFADLLSYYPGVLSIRN